jgi:hypothetical protein
MVDKSSAAARQVVVFIAVLLNRPVGYQRPSGLAGYAPGSTQGRSGIRELVIPADANGIVGLVTVAVQYGNARRHDEVAGR